MELGFLEEYDIDACLWIGALGETGAYAVGDALTGEVNPSRVLVDTYAYDSLSAPSMANFGYYSITNSEVPFGNGYMVYGEGIYVGYLYYETRYEDVVLGNEDKANYDYTAAVQYPLGYGLSYTDFEWSDYSVRETDTTYEISVTVTNTGDVAGKDIVQIYMQSPYTDYDKENAIEKASVELVGFAKTSNIEAAKSETVTISVDKEEMKTYDAKGYGTYIVDAGDYYFAAGNDAHDALNNILAHSIFLLMLVVLFFTAFLGQTIFLSGTTDYSRVNYQGATYDFFNCTLVLVVQYSIFRISTLNREKEIVKQMLYERQKQYKLSKENIDIINQKCHDLKHQIQALKEADSEELEKYIDEVEDSIMIYDTVVKTENEVLNTILSEKSLYCDKHRIRLTCMVDASQLDFMSTLDIYALLGNALDNAIECVIKHKDKEKRVISLTISANGSFLSIQTNNYYEGNIEFVDGLPVSIKKNQAFHGFGMKSMKHLTEKYGGTLYTSLENGIFMLQIVIPIPSEFSRLLKEAKAGRS